MRELNPHVSVDCVIFGFENNSLKVLLVKRNYFDEQRKATTSDLKLPGSLVYIDEDINDAANRVLLELTGLKDIFLEQLYTFGSPSRTSNKIDVDWLASTTHLSINRIVSIAYYSLIKLHDVTLINTPQTLWMDVYQIDKLAFDHIEIMNKGLEVLRSKISSEPIAFELLPKKFTINQLQKLYESVLDKKLDNRNFRKKLSNQPYITTLSEKQQKVSHKPAQLYKFDKKLYKKTIKESILYSF